ncbi:hypothetical protein [Streptomyces sp. HmicA12]|uniref:hypothetical protein n=1 Tax=Streptomyces sp. HmicA12 TaxID=1156844 RepID=UPI000375CE64|nr:hypothetical protein [Streptomyces sp. HmicA12]
MNDGPRRPADAAADDASGSEPHGGTGADSGAGLGDDELALRRMMRQAVAEIGPPGNTDAALDHLRRAVPARRARRRQATVGAIAAGVFVAMAVPAVLHVTNSTTSGDRPSIAGNSTATQGSGGSGKSAGAGGHDSAGSPSHSKDKGKDGNKGKKGDQGKGSGSGATAGTDPASTAAASSPTCDANELGTPVPTVGQPDAGGTVYGSFRVTNTSTDNCTVDSGGSLVTIAQGAADPAKVSVVDHTSGDRAAGLPDPSTEPSQLVLEPGKAYEVRFAWVPSAPCTPAGGGSGGTGGGEEPSPSPSTSGDTTPTAGDSADTAQLATQLGSEGTEDGSVVVSHTAEPGAPAAAATIPDACAGTVYRTGLLPAS